MNGKVGRFYIEVPRPIGNLFILVLVPSKHLFIFISYFYRFFFCRFKKEHKIDGVIGLVDGTHIGITNLKKDIEFQYVNRKGTKSINVQIVRIIYKIINLMRYRFIAY